MVNMATKTPVIPPCAGLQEYTRILKYLNVTRRGNESTFGFVFYRCYSYDDNARWADFMGIVKRWALHGLESETDGITIKDRMILDVVEDPASSNADKNEIRRSVFLLNFPLAGRHSEILHSFPLLIVLRRHRECVESKGVPFNPALPRHAFPILVNQESLDSVLAGPAPGDYGDVFNSRAYLVMI